MAIVEVKPAVAPPVRAAGFGAGALLVAVVIVFGVAVRFVGLESNLYWRDEVATSLRLAGLTMSEVAERLGRDRELRPSEITALMFPSRPAPLSEVLGSVLVDESHRAPLYYVLAWLHTSIFETSPLALRLLSLVSGFLVLPAAYWLCRELFPDRAVAVIGTMLFATSPFHVQYAQEAREYSLWTALVLASSAALLMARRRNDVRGWIVYALLSAAAVQTTLIHALMIASHGLFLLWHWFVNDDDRHWWPLPAYLVTFASAAVCAVLTLVPWLWAGQEYRANAQDATAWMYESISRSNMAREWIKTFSRPFVGFAGEEWLYPVMPRVVAYAFSFGALTLTGWSLVALWLRRDRREFAAPFVSLLILVTLLAVLVPDLLFGGVRSIIGRYLVPVWIGFALAVAATFAAGCRAPTRAGRFWRAGLVMLLTVSATSSAVLAAHPGWGKTFLRTSGDEGLRVVQEIAASPRPIVISEQVDRWDIRAGDTLVFSMLLDDHARMVISDDPALALRLSQQGEVFIVEPTDRFIEALSSVGVLESVRPVPPVLRLRAR